MRRMLVAVGIVAMVVTGIGLWKTRRHSPISRPSIVTTGSWPAAADHGSPDVPPPPSHLAVATAGAGGHAPAAAPAPRAISPSIAVPAPAPPMVVAPDALAAPAGITRPPPLPPEPPIEPRLTSDLMVGTPIEPPPIPPAAPPASAPSTGATAAQGAAAASSLGPDSRGDIPSRERNFAGVRAVVDGYVRAYNRLDAGAAATFWPSIDSAALERAFARLEKQEIELHDCLWAVSEPNATAQCRGWLTYVPRVGNPSAHRESHSWTIELERAGESWRIIRMKAQ